jgi:hypothetical protein
LPHLTIEKIDHAFVQCPKCGNYRRYEWARNIKMTPPSSAFCQRCKTRTPWEDNHFLTEGEYFNGRGFPYWETKNEDGKPE